LYGQFLACDSDEGFIQTGPRFHLLSHAAFPPGAQLWAAFTKLVENVPLPLADIGIVHADIQCPHRHVHDFNILDSWNDGGSIELRLIDLESLVDYGALQMEMYRSLEYAVTTGRFSILFPHPYHFCSGKCCGWRMCGAQCWRIQAL
jgi:hypothetical protein